VPGKTYDPRGKANRALLVGVYRYEHSENLPGVKHNLGELYSALMDGDVFGSEEVVPISPDKRIHFLDRLEEAAEHARGLLLLYFAGHGRLSRDGSDLFLAVGESRPVDGSPAVSEPVSWKHDVLPKLRDVADAGSVEQIVVILDCCNAGNALEEFKPGALQRGRDRISVLTAVQVNRRIPGGNGREPTPYTKELVRLLREGMGDAPDGERGLVTLDPLAAALREAMQGQRTVLGDPWEPRYHRAETDQDVMIGVAAGPPRPKPWWLDLARLRVQIGAAFPWLPSPRRLLVPLLATCTVLAAAGGYGVYQLVGGTADCPPPVELRLLTDPDTAPTVTSAVDHYVSSTDNHDSHGCRRSGITTEAPESTDAVRAFQNATQWQKPGATAASTAASPGAGDTGDFQPQRDVGAQPDIWIPGSIASVEEATTEHGPARLDSLGPVAYSPLVLAVPANLFTAQLGSTNTSLSDLVETLRQRNPGSVVLRADPEYTDTGQLATVGLYGANPGEAQVADVNGLEQQAARLSPAPRSSADLMCALASDPANRQLATQAAVLMSEQVMAQFNDRVGAQARLGCDTGRLNPRTPEYPSDLGMLDLPFVHVTWQGADRDTQARAAAVSSFSHWLVGAAGQQVFTDAGYRGRGAEQGRPAPPAAGSWLVDAEKGGALRDPQPIGYDVAGRTVAAALDRYRKARGPGRVLYLMDDSPSMSQTPSRLELAKSLIAQSLDSLSTQDYYGVRAMPGPGTGEAGHDVVRLAAHDDPAAVRATLARADIAGREADPGAALSQALGEMRTLGKDGRPQLIVLVTDEEDDNHISGDVLTQVLDTARADRIPVDWVSLATGGCDGAKQGPRVAEAAGGHCIGLTGNQASELRDDVARVGTGDTQ
jgi:hypothetical protein